MIRLTLCRLKASFREFQAQATCGLDRRLRVTSHREGGKPPRWLSFLGARSLEGGDPIRSCLSLKLSK